MNGNYDLTYEGPEVQDILDAANTLEADGYIFCGVATPSTNPGTPTEKVYYQAKESGTYTNFGGVTLPNGLHLLMWNGSWSTQTLFVFENTPVIKNSIFENTDLDIVDENNNILARFSDGNFRTKNFESQKTPKTEETEPNTDLDIVDENSNILARFSDGNFRTKNFNSRIVNSLLIGKFKNKKIAIIGDSISTYNGWLPSDIAGYDGTSYVTYYPHGNVDSVQKTWWYNVAMMLGLNPETDINNCSWSGSRVTGNSLATDSAYAGCSTRRISDLSIRGYIPDIVLIFISCNDWGHDIPVGNWSVSSAIPSEGEQTTLRDAYSLMINKIHTTYPYARIFCCTNLDDLKRDATPNWPSNNGNGISTYEWNQNITEVANALGCDIIDMHRCGVNYANILNYVVDEGLHPNAAGHILMAKKVVSELIAKF